MRRVGIATNQNGDTSNMVFVWFNGLEDKKTQFDPSADIHIGFTHGTKSEFAALTASQLTELVYSYVLFSDSVSVKCSDIIFFAMFKTGHAPTSGELNANGFISPISSTDIASGGDCPHSDVTIDGTTYKIYGIRNPDLVGDRNTITLNI